jgi:hypothetical protein
MESTAPSQQERSEMERVLQSGIFDKAPRLGRFFQYICDRYFEGEADRLKEYSIAIEALGRSPEFDPKKDSIVRVEAHRLRKRLMEYYQTEGAQHSMRIVIPNGQYRPHFLNREDLPAAAVPPAPALEQLGVVSSPEFSPSGEPPSANKHLGWHRFWGIAVSGALVVVGMIAFAARSRHAKAEAIQRPAPAGQNAVQNEVWKVGGAQPAAAEIRILAGYHGPVYMDRQGHAWQADAYYTGGKSELISGDTQIEGEPDPHLLRTIRSGAFRYDIPLLPGTHELHLYFVETEYGHGNPGGGGEGTRTFRVSVNGETKLPYFDPLAEAGAPNRLHVRVLKDVVPASDGKLHLQFDPAGTAAAILSGIEILPSAAGKIHPVRIVMQMNPVADSDGRVWAADEFYSGGTVVWRENLLISGRERALYQGERYGNFTYRIPLAPGKYKLNLLFAEQWFGTPQSQRAPLDSRSFDVFANGVAILRNFCLGGEAHGPNRALRKSFENIQPNAQGDLRLEFVPVKNYAELNAIEVTEIQ